MKNKIITFVFFASLLIQNSTQTQFDLKQLARGDNKIHLIYGGVILVLLCGGCGGYYKYKKLKSTSLSKTDDKITMTDEERQDLEDYRAIKYVKIPRNNEKSWYTDICYNDQDLLHGFTNEQTKQEKTLKEIIQKNREAKRIT